MLRQVFFTQGDLAEKRTINLAHNERVVSVQASDRPGLYLVFVGEEIDLPPTVEEVREQLRPVIVPVSVAPPRRWWHR
jgi:hypothetical protein